MGSSVGKELGYFQKRELCLKWKNSMCGTFQDLLKSCVSFGGGLHGSNEEKMGEATEGRASRVKCRKALLELKGMGWGVACEDLVGAICDGMIETVKCIWVNI